MTMDADGSMAMVYTTEQQARLHVDVFGSSVGASTAQQQSNTHYGNPVHSALAKVRTESESLPVTLFVRSLLHAAYRPSSWLAGCSLKVALSACWCRTRTISSKNIDAMHR